GFTGSVPGWLRLTYDGAGDFTGYYDTADSSATTVPDPSSPNWVSVSTISGETGITNTPEMLLGLGLGTHQTASTYTTVYDNISQWASEAPVGAANNILPVNGPLVIGSGG